MVQAGKLIGKADEDDLLFPNLDPLVDDDFVLILARMTLALITAAERQEAKALRDALDLLDVNWKNLSPAAQSRLIAGAQAVISGSVDKVIPRTSPIFERAARAIIPATKENVIARDGLTIAATLSQPDIETGRALLRQQGLYIRDEFGRRADVLAVRAREIVAQGIELGLGQEDMAAQLATDITLRQMNRSRAYWEVIATAFANRARTTIQLNSYLEAGITTYRFVAVLDERTTDICRYMNGKTFSVQRALERQRRAETMTDAADIKDIQPWVSKGVENGKSILYYERRGKRFKVAQINESAVGVRDEVGLFSDGLTNAQLEAAGLQVPPLHGKCRSTIVTEES